MSGVWYGRTRIWDMSASHFYSSSHLTLVVLLNPSQPTLARLAHWPKLATVPATESSCRNCAIDVWVVTPIEACTDRFWTAPEIDRGHMSTDFSVCSSMVTMWWKGINTSENHKRSFSLWQKGIILISIPLKDNLMFLTILYLFRLRKNLQRCRKKVIDRTFYWS